MGVDVVVVIFSPAFVRPISLRQTQIPDRPDYFLPTTPTAISKPFLYFLPAIKCKCFLSLKHLALTIEDNSSMSQRICINKYKTL